MLQITFNCPTPHYGDQLIQTQNSGFTQHQQIQYEISFPQLYTQFIRNTSVLNQNNRFLGSSRVINTQQTAIEDEANWLAQEIVSNLFFLDFCRNQLKKDVNLKRIDWLIFHVKLQLLEQISLFQNFLGFNSQVWGQFASDSGQDIASYLEKEISSFIKIRGPQILQRPTNIRQQLFQMDPEDSDCIKLSKYFLSQIIRVPYFFMQRGLCSYFIQTKRTVKRILQCVEQLNE